VIHPASVTTYVAPETTTVIEAPAVETTYYEDASVATTTTTTTTTDPGFDLVGANVSLLGINVGAGVKVGGGTTVSRTTRVTHAAPATRKVWIGGYYNSFRDASGRIVREYVPGHYETVAY
jgi:hypothetical protein